MKQFDDIFREKAEKAFSSYNADHLADAGWKSFVAARRGGRRLRAVIPLWARAASVILIIGAGAFLTYIALNRHNSEEVLVAGKTGPAIITPSSAQPEAAPAISPAVAETAELLPGSREAVREVNLKAAILPEQPEEERQLMREEITVPADTDRQPVVAENRLPVSDDSVNLAVEAALKEVLEDEPATAVTEEADKRSGRTTFMVGMSGLLAHVDETTSSAPGVSVGFYVEQKITERISLRPGLALAYNSLGVDGRNAGSEFSYSVPLYNGNSGTPDSYSGQLSMFAMEVPLNFVFRVLERKGSSLYLSTGASTMIYFSQQFSGDLVNAYTQKQLNTASGLMDSETRYSTITVENTYGAFRRTDYFGLANFSAGYSLPYGKTGTLLIEPFLQLPLRDLTALDLRVRYGGVSMKLRFGSQNSGNGK
ncbi:MAG: PorT family protein [Bacteroidales bacterium]|nr:PorT family protein [Bacteroidales bacterium]